MKKRNHQTLENPLLFPFAAIACGICISKWFSFSASEVLVLFTALSAATLLARLAKARIACSMGWLAALTAFGIGLMLLHAPGTPPTLSVPDQQTVLLEGCVVEPGMVAADREKFVLELSPGARAQVSLYVREGEDFPALPYGSRIEFAGKVRTPHNYNNPGSFDFAGYLRHQKIFWNASGNADTIKVLPGQCGTILSRWTFRLRMAALDRLDHLYASDNYTNGMMQAVLFGATAKLERMWTEDYRATGTFHALVISGSHVAVLSGVLLFFFRMLGVPGGIAAALAIASAWLYSGVTGWQAPVVRSAAGMTIFGLGRIFYREGRLLNVLAGVAVFFVLFDPSELFDASFQLSFFSVALIGVFVIPAADRTSAPLRGSLGNLMDCKGDSRLAPAVAQFRLEMRLLAQTLALYGFPGQAAARAVAAVSAVLFFFWELILTSFFIQLGLALPMIMYFHRMAFSGLSANAIVVPVLSAVVPLGFLAVAFNSTWIAGLCTPLMAFAQWTAGMHARWEPDLRIPSPPLWLAVAFVFALILAGFAPRWWLKWLAWPAALAALAAIAVHPFPPDIVPRQFELTQIDVGQGDSALAVFPRGKLLLVDAGGIPTFNRKHKPGIDIGEDVVSNYLWTRSIKHLDAIVMTHAHEDHMGGMAAVIRNFRPRELWTGATPDCAEWREVEAAARKFGVWIRPMQAHTKFAYSGATVEVLAPVIGYIPSDKPKNNDSLVLRISYGSTSFLMTGDMEKQVEQQLVSDGVLAQTTVLKAGHHGSRTSSTPDFLDLVHPAFGIISAGFENSYGHPHPATLAALSERHISTLRTDQSGLVRMVSDGSRIQIF